MALSGVKVSNFNDGIYLSLLDATYQHRLTALYLFMYLLTLLPELVPSAACRMARALATASESLLKGFLIESAVSKKLDKEF